MKKFVSFALALMMISAMAVTAFAAVDSISFDKDENGVVLGQDLLAPGTTYKFSVLIAKDGAVNSDFSKEDMEGHKFEITVTKGGSAITTPKVEDEDGKYYLTFTTASNHAPKATEVGVKVRYMSRNPLKELASVNLEFSVGYAQLDDSALESLEKGDTLEVPPSTPVVTAKQLEAFAKLNDYKAVTFSYGDWTFTGKVNDLGDLNLHSSQTPILEIVKKYDDNQFKFLSFLGKPKFSDKGTLTIDVSDVEQDFGGKFFLYKYQDNRLYKLNFKYDEAAGTISFNPSDLGRYFITDKEITDVEVGGSGSGSSSGNSSSTSGSSSSSGSQNSGSETNPETGAGGGLGAAAVVTIGIAALALTLVKKK